jgi:hypothetical protein
MGRIEDKLTRFIVNALIGLIGAGVLAWACWVSSGTVEAKQEAVRLSGRMDKIESVQNLQFENIKTALTKINEKLDWHLGLSAKKPEPSESK